MLFQYVQKASRIKIQEACKVGNDEWAETVRGRLEFAQDLHAADAVCHQTCSVNFRTGKQIPKKHAGMILIQSVAGKVRPTDTVKSKAFFKGHCHAIWRLYKKQEGAMTSIEFQN